MTPSTPATLLAFLMKRELVTPEEARKICRTADLSPSRRRPRKWDETLTQFESIIGRTV